MAATKEKEIAILCIRNLNQYLEGKIRKEEWENNLRCIKEMIDQQQVLPLHGSHGKGPHPLESTSDN
ncbi:MAG: hypothetical protein ACE5JS_14370, partial [Nitrospinota bacterium]